MIVKTQGVVLNYIKYGDTSIIARVYTSELGFGSFIVSSLRSSRSKRSIGNFQPFSLLELVVYVKESRDLQRVSEFRNVFPLHGVHQDFTKSAITMLLAEVLGRLLQSEKEPNASLFFFISESIKSFNDLRQGVENFHLQFLLKIGAHLGFAIDAFETVFTSVDKLVPHEEGHHVVQDLVEEPYGVALIANKDIRNELLDAILEYYRHHVDLPNPKSLAVLRRVLN